MTNKHKDIIRLARHWGATETYTRMIFETILKNRGHLTNRHKTPPQGHQMPYNSLIDTKT